MQAVCACNTCESLSQSPLQGSLPSLCLQGQVCLSVPVALSPWWGTGLGKGASEHSRRGPWSFAPSSVRALRRTFTTTQLGAVGLSLRD